MSHQSRRSSPRLNRSSEKDMDKFLRPKSSRSGRQNNSQMSESEETPRTLISNVLGGLDSEVPVTRQHTRIIPTPATHSSRKRRRSSVSNLVQKAAMNDMRQKAVSEETPRTLIKNVLGMMNDVTPVVATWASVQQQNVASSQPVASYNAAEVSKNESAHEDSYLHDHVRPSQSERDPSSQLGRQMHFKLDRLKKARFVGEAASDTSQLVIPSSQATEIYQYEADESNHSTNSSITVDSFMKDYIRPSQEVHRSQSSQLGNRNIRLDSKRLQEAKFIDSVKKKERQQLDRINRTANLETLAEFDPGTEEQGEGNDESPSASMVPPSVSEMDENAQPLPDLSVHEVTERHSTTFQRNAIADASKRRSIANRSRVSMKENLDVSTGNIDSRSVNQSRVSVRDINEDGVMVSPGSASKSRRLSQLHHSGYRSIASNSRIEDDAEMSPRIELKRVRRSLVLETQMSERSERNDERVSDDDDVIDDDDEEDHVIPDSQESGWEDEDYLRGKLNPKRVEDQGNLDMNDGDIGNRSNHQRSDTKNATLDRSNRRKSDRKDSVEGSPVTEEGARYEDDRQPTQRPRESLISGRKSTNERSHRKSDRKQSVEGSPVTNEVSRYEDDRQPTHRPRESLISGRNSANERSLYKDGNQVNSLLNDDYHVDDAERVNEWQTSRRSSKGRSTVDRSLHQDGNQEKSLPIGGQDYVEDHEAEENERQLSSGSHRSNRSSAVIREVDQAENMEEGVGYDIQDIQERSEMSHVDRRGSSRSGPRNSFIHDEQSRHGVSFNGRAMDSSEIVERQVAGMRASIANVNSTRLTSFSAALDRISVDLGSRSSVGMETNKPVTHVAPLKEISVLSYSNASNLGGTQSRRASAISQRLRTSAGNATTDAGEEESLITRQNRRSSISTAPPIQNITGRTEGRTEGRSISRNSRSYVDDNDLVLESEVISQPRTPRTNRSSRMSNAADVTPSSGLRSEINSQPRTPRSRRISNAADVTPSSGLRSEINSRPRTSRSGRSSRISNAADVTPSSRLRSASKSATPKSSRVDTPKSGRRSFLQRQSSRENTPRSTRRNTPQQQRSIRTPEESTRMEYQQIDTPSGGDQHDQHGAVSHKTLQSVTRQGTIQTYFSPLDTSKTAVQKPPRVNLLEKLISGSQKNRQVLNTHRERLQPLAKKPRANRAVQRTVATPSSRRKKEPRVPTAITKSIFTHFSRCRVPRESLQKIEEISDAFWKNLVQDLSALTSHAGRHTVNKADVEILMRRQGFLGRDQSINLLIESHLPLEYRKELIPMARAGNVVVPKE